MPAEVAQGIVAPARFAALPTLRPSRWQGLLGFTLTEIRVQSHETLALGTSMIVQTVFIIFVLVLNPSLLPFALVGAVIFSVFQIGERVTNEAAYIRIDHRLTELYHASPLTPEAYFFGMAIGVMTAYLPPVVFLAVLTEVLHPLGPAATLLFVLALVGIWLFAASLGYVFSTLFQDSRAIWPYSSLFYNAFGVLPPVFYPFATWTHIVSPTVQPLALLLPPSATAALVANAAGLPGAAFSGGEVVTAVVAVIVEALAMFAFAVYWSRRAAVED
jgi:ABC-2 type transport system permease protein